MCLPEAVTAKPSGQNVLGSVDVRVLTVPAACASKSRLALARCRIHTATTRTRLRRVRSWHFQDFRTCPPGGTVQRQLETVPTLVKHRPVQPGLLCNLPSRLVRSTTRRGRHVPDSQIFQHDERVCAHEAARDPGTKVFPPVTFPTLQHSHRGNCFLPVLGRLCLPGQFPLQTPVALALPRSVELAIPQPFEQAIAAFTPRSTPTAELGAGCCSGAAVPVSTRSETNQRPPARDTVADRIIPPIERDQRKRTRPSLGSFSLPHR